MFSVSTNVANLMTGEVIGGESFSDAGISGREFTLDEGHFVCFINMRDLAQVNNNLGGGPITLNKHGKIEINVYMEADEVLIVDINTNGIDHSSRLIYDEVAISDNPPDGIANYLPAEEVYRLITSKAQGAARIRTVSLRLESVCPNNSSSQQEWKIGSIKVWKGIIS